MHANYDRHDRFSKGFILQTLLLLNQNKMTYGVQSPPRQSSSSVYLLYLGANANDTKDGKLSWRKKPY